MASHGLKVAGAQGRHEGPDAGRLDGLYEDVSSLHQFRHGRHLSLVRHSDFYRGTQTADGEVIVFPTFRKETHPGA